MECTFNDENSMIFPPQPKKKRLSKVLNDDKYKFEIPQHLTFHVPKTKFVKKPLERGEKLNELVKMIPCFIYSHNINKRGSAVKKKEYIEAIAKSFSGNVFRKTEKEVNEIFDVFLEVAKGYFTVKRIEETEYVIRKQKEYDIEGVLATIKEAIEIDKKDKS